MWRFCKTGAIILPLSLILAACGTTEVQTHRAVTSVGDAQGIFGETFAKAIHTENKVEASCYFGENEWNCSAHSLKGSGETLECQTAIGTVSRTGEVSVTNSGTASSECEEPNEGATEAYSHTPAGEASNRKHAEEEEQLEGEPETALAETATDKEETEECYRNKELTPNGSQRCVALLRLRESELPDHGASEGSYTDEKGYTYKDNQHETYCSDSPYAALPSCEGG